ncbi:hypothetical protein FOG48_01971 [Hanseniaspora uvarum]|nr:hypothetical protein FOG48_01971 [Hanseniaspora uvarum]
MDNQQVFDILNGENPEIANDNVTYSLNDENDEDKILSLDNQNGLKTPSHPQYRPNTSSGGTTPSGSTNRIRRNGSMRRSLLFVSGTGMQIPSPAPSNKSPYSNNRLSESSDVLLGSQRRDNLSPSTKENFSPNGRIRAYSHSYDEIHREIEKSPEQTNIQLSESTQHPLIITKNSSKGANRYITPTPINPTDFPQNKSATSSPIVPGNSERKHVRRASSFSSRSLLMTPNSSSNNAVNNSVKKNPDFQNLNIFNTSVENHTAENSLADESIPNKSVVKDNEMFAPAQEQVEEEDPSAKLFSKLASKEAQILESKSELEELKKKVKLKEEQIKDEEAQLEALKQEMAAKLLKTHQRAPQQTTSKMSDILGLTRKSAPSLAPPESQSMNKNVPSEIMETSFSEELKFPTNTQQSYSNKREFNDIPGNGLFGNSHETLFDSQDDLDDVVYSLNSPQKKPVEKFEVATEDIPEAFENHPKSEDQTENSSFSEMLDTNFPLKDNTHIITPTAKHKASQSMSMARELPNRKNMPQRSKSRMSMYFSKTVSLMSQFDQILQNELEKKMGLDDDVKIAEEEETEEEIMDLPPRPDEIDNLHSSNVPKKQHARSLSSYRFFG